MIMLSLHDNAVNLIEEGIRRVACSAHILQLSTKKGLSLNEIKEVSISHFRHSVLTTRSLEKKIRTTIFATFKTYSGLSNQMELCTL